MTHTLLRGDVAKILGVSPTRVGQLDDDLRPQKGENGWRRYAPEDVERVRAERAQRGSR